MICKDSADGYRGDSCGVVFHLAGKELSYRIKNTMMRAGAHFLEK